MSEVNVKVDIKLVKSRELGRLMYAWFLFLDNV